MRLALSRMVRRDTYTFANTFVVPDAGSFGAKPLLCTLDDDRPSTP
jgi:hypothetical protein